MGLRGYSLICSKMKTLQASAGTPLGGEKWRLTKAPFENARGNPLAILAEKPKDPYNAIANHDTATKI